MSHKAVSWALEQKKLKPAPWVVLIKLADRHNKDTFRCDPNQALLATDCNMSRASINRHLEALEAEGYLWRIPRENRATGKSLSTFYVLAINFDAPPTIEHATIPVGPRTASDQNENADQNHVSNCDTETMSQNDTEPCLNLDENHVSNCDTNLKTKPVSKPCAPSGPAIQNEVFQEFEDFRRAYPRLGSLEKTKAELRKAIEAGVSMDQILNGAREYAKEQTGNRAAFKTLSENWLKDRRWEAYDWKPEDANLRRKVLEGRAKAIRNRASWALNSTSFPECREMIAAEVITQDELIEAGFKIRKDVELPS